jgi:leucyl aminopeptidase
MTDLANVSFVKPARKIAGTVVAFVGDDLQLGKAATALGVAGLVRQAAATAEFKGKPRTVLDLLAPRGTELDRLVVIGVGKPEALTETDWVKLGGATIGALGKAAKATLLFERPDGVAVPGAAAAEFALGVKLRAYSFDIYRPDSEDAPKRKKPTDVAIAVDDLAGAKAAWVAQGAVADGVILARDLINEPANVLGPVEFANRARALKDVGIEVEVLTETQMRKLGMRALLGVAQGSARPPRLVVMRWNGGKAKDAPLAFVGKGVVFDTGGISIKPAAGMEDMKGDMGGAAAVTGLMHTLAARKAKVNAVGVIGIVENMPDGAAQRPGDIVTSMSGQTIEIINTDAEGRLVLADVLWYTAKQFKPKFMVDLATLTGAIVIALGHENAGLFSNDDKLAERLTKAGQDTGELVWRMPLAPEYDKQIDSKFADVKNTGGSRWGGAITAAQFIQRFVADKTPWAHLDIAGAGFDSRHTETNKSWGSGWGVRLLDRLVADYYEK